MDTQSLYRDHTKQAKDYNFGISSLPWVSGRDVAGFIDQVSDSVTNFSPRDAVFTLTDYTSARCGAFQDYCIAHHASVALIPPNLTFEEAASIPVGAITAGVALKRYTGISPKDHNALQKESQDWVLVWGGVTCTGYYVVQLASLYGYKVISVAGKDNLDYVRQAGADVVLDREMEDEDLVAVIRRATSGQLSYAFDAVGPVTAGLCLQVMDTGKSCGKKTLVALAGIPKQAKTAGKGGQPLELSSRILVNTPEIKVKIFHSDPEFGQELLQELTTYLINGQLQVPRIRIMDGGLEDVNKGLSLLKKGEISGSKLVIRVDRTAESQGGLHYHGWL
ncbi:unnamed protein product [Clonostachys rosea]|uniref:Enoyl reductase (ER) domain-containing protein n=1 Tax=Bionectria ochroleuca TaxID=29856 RepID=A0ABY6TZS8_BIOOC|nr:unnamed protein product [Clonostachys rosea]